MRSLALLVLVGGCGHAAATGGTLALRDACAANQRWDGHACVGIGVGADDVAHATDALIEFKVDDAAAALDHAAASGPLAYDAHVGLWEQRGILHGYLDRPDDAARAFDMLLALDPAHHLSCRISPKATEVFEHERADPSRRAPAIDVVLGHRLLVGRPIPVEIDVVADPRAFLARATLYVRQRGDATWRAADLALPKAGGFARLALPAFAAPGPTSLELYLRAYDTDGNEVLSWADPTRPREVPLAYAAPQRWYRKWWIWAAAGSAVAIGTGVGVYAATWTPSDRLGGTVSHH